MFNVYVHVQCSMYMFNDAWWCLSCRPDSIGRSLCIPRDYGMLVVPSRLYRTESVHTQSLRYADLTRSSCCCTSSSTWTIQRSAGAVLLVHRHHSDSAAAGLFSEHEHYSDPAAADAFPGHRHGVFSRRSCHGSALRKSSTRVPLSGDAAQEGGSPREQMGPFECVCVCVSSGSDTH